MMQQSARRQPPAWLFGMLAVGMLISSGIYIGTIRAWEATCGRIIAAVAFGATGVVFVAMTAASARACERMDRPKR